MSENVPESATDPLDEWYIPVGDPKRQLGALVDLLVSVGLVVGLIAFVVLADSAGAGALFPLTLPLFFVLDIAVYAAPLSRWGWSIGNLITGRRVIDRATGAHLSVRAAVRRYWARRLAGLVLRNQFRRELRLGESVAPSRLVSRADLASGSAVISSSTPSWVLAGPSAPPASTAVFVPVTEPPVWAPPIST